MSRNSGPHPLCIGKCKEFQAQRPKVGKRYQLGQKLCQECDQWIFHEGVMCPCCHNRLRTRPRCKKYKTKVARI
ncbi:hypothetical protein AAA799E16_01711 [Marine Group I thaumarchaeote SCGC AAA799-E16]|uniref:Uncharacterized protein n=4 Tax=Marine Group I TaxID=905826 RepID=A0A081RMU6_9ARCH|nr:hypothetical protein AAA799N04_01011 [Marine Group I thaumarchaeote SCGC AAA799-N04]KER05635.1 hypothetical protein AAA799E16_01711 [Marine Group I thaumarchaeote SCGC AAA799-E16]KFM15572.1 hypothetical protein AAA799D11_01177 [Marine Group I thaumarchaeote SCGC AAA799-D11]KFM16772.1 hypothetical protein SCCGRSA3_02089 [Marine Group I thaumarchaeote SCGC RSA3]